MRAIRGAIESVADLDTIVLLRGETGVGKDLVARAIHAASSRRDRRFVKVNCAAIPGELLESELFGYEKGAFTGASRRKPGQFELADGGTIYLDEIAELPRALQAKLLHVLQDLRFSRIGGHRVIAVDTRVIAATNRNLEEARTRGEFREDLYYRLNAVEIWVPALRERREEIPALASRFLGRFNAQYGRAKELGPRAIAALANYSWPGNVRELENVIRRFVVLEDGDDFVEALSGPSRRRDPAAAPPALEGLREMTRRAAREAERRLLGEVLEQVLWDRAAAARRLGVSYKTLLNKIVEHDLIRPTSTARPEARSRTSRPRSDRRPWLPAASLGDHDGADGPQNGCRPERLDE
jgi:transcriptional regulator with PAS, ATPase and Fis domain